MNGLQPMAEAKIALQYPPIYKPAHHEMKPLVVTDMHCNVLVWYLLHILMAARQVSAARARYHRN